MFRSSELDHMNQLKSILSGNLQHFNPLLLSSVEPIWYLAYGSNLSSNTFIGVRGIKPLDRKAVIVHGLELTFDLPGLPYIEPRFANSRLADKESNAARTESDLWKIDDPWTGDNGKLIGVAYLLTPSDFARVLATEGGGATYQMVVVDAVVLPSPTAFKDEEKTQTSTPEHIDAYTLIAPPSQRPYLGKPSSRYLNIIREGAKEHNLPVPYRAYLDSLKPYAAHTLSQKIARVLFVLMWFPAILLSLLLILISSGICKDNAILPVIFKVCSIRKAKDVSSNEGAVILEFEEKSRTVASATEDVKSAAEIALESTTKFGPPNRSFSLSSQTSTSTASGSTLEVADDPQYRKPGESPKWAKKLSNLIMRAMWRNYDNFWVRYFGDGEGRDASDLFQRA